MVLRSVIDSHHHLWNPETLEPDVGYVWLRRKGEMKPFGDPSLIQRDYLLEEYVGEYGGILGSVHVQSDGGIKDPVRETEFVQGLADGFDFPLVIVGFVDLSREDAEGMLKRHKAFGRFCGVRQILSRIEGREDISFASCDYLRDERWRDQFVLLAEEGLIFDLQLYPEQMREAAEFLSRYEGVPVVIDHAGSPYDLGDEGRKRWREGMKLLGELEHVSVKMSGYGMYDKIWERGGVGYVMDGLLEFFGMERVMFGSNYPVDKLMRGYGEIVEDLRGYVGVDGEDRFFVENAKRVYGLGDFFDEE
jgi:predicted TIM-barrel fold metal-dependent hydrolase